MEAENLNASRMPGFVCRSLPAILPVLMVSVGYVDPGKWAATVEGGAQYGFDLVALTLLFNFSAIMCQYLSARIGVVTGKDLAEICSDEYNMWACMFLGILTEISVIALDLSMILGMAHGLNLVFGWDLVTCVLLTAANAVLFPILTFLLENRKAKVLCLCLAGFILLSYTLGVLNSQSEIPLMFNGLHLKLSGDSAFALMSLLGANIMPHNFYLHSYITKWHQRPPSISKDALCHNHFWAILCIFGGINLVSNVLLNSAANAFCNTGLVLLNFQDALSLMDQMFRSPAAPFAFLLILFLSNQLTAITWSFGGQVVLHRFLRLHIPGWLHYATIRIIAIVPAFYCVFSARAEGMYQLLIFTQVVVALLLPSSLVPLFRIAASRSIMGANKISPLMEFSLLAVFIGVLGLNIIFGVEMVFGSSDWVGNLRWTIGDDVSISYILLLFTVCASFGLMLWVAATPLKSAGIRLDPQEWVSDLAKAELQRDEPYFTGTRYYEDVAVPKQESLPVVPKAKDCYSDVSIENFQLGPVIIMEPEQEVNLTTVNKSHSNATFPHSTLCDQGSKCKQEPEAVPVSVPVQTMSIKLSDAKLLDIGKTTDSAVPVEKTVEVEGDMCIHKDDDVDTWETEELSSPQLTSGTLGSTNDGPSSFRSLGGRSDEGGSNNAGSLSKLAGLGRAARRQLTEVLNEFWGQLYDFHGQEPVDSKSKKNDSLLGTDPKLASPLLKKDASEKELTAYLQGGEGSMMNSSLYKSPKHQSVQNNIDSYDVKMGSSSIWTNHVLNSGERRYSSVRNLPSSEAWDHQLCTVHGCQIASYLNQNGKEKNLQLTGSGHLTGQMEVSALKSPSLGPTNYGDPPALALEQKFRNGLMIRPAPGFENVAVSRNGRQPSERPHCNFSSSAVSENLVGSVDNKKYHSLPGVSWYSIHHRNTYTGDKSARWENPIGYGSSAGRSYYEPSYYNSGSRMPAPLAFDALSPTNVYSDALSSQRSSSLDNRSLWARQPFEQFGVADLMRGTAAGGVLSGQSSTGHEATIVDSEAKLLQSFRQCIVKLLRLEGSDWLFGHHDGADEDLIDCVAAREKFLYEAEAQYSSSDRKSGSTVKSNEASINDFLVSSVPHCGERCVWRSDLIVSFGVWCIHRILHLSIMESRPELWGKYTYVLNRLQGIIDSAFSKPRSPLVPCFCLQVPAAHLQKLSLSASNGPLPPTAKQSRGKCTSASMILDLIKDVEISVSSRKGRSGTAAGDVAFPKGKWNLGSVLKRYKRRLSNKPVGTHEGSDSRMTHTPATNGS